jgi:hypothetical protein
MRYRSFTFVCLVAVALTAARAVSYARPSRKAETMLTEMRELFEIRGSRAPGAPGNLALEEHVAQVFEDSGFEHGEMRFLAPVFVPGAASITLPAGEEIVIQTMHPTLMRPGNFRERSFDTSLVYLGKGSWDDIRAAKGVDLAGSVALMDFDCGKNWLHLLRFGIKGFVFMGADKYEYGDSRDKIYNSEVAVPRYFAAKEDGARLRSSMTGLALTNVTVKSEPSTWRTKELRNLWVFIPGSDAELAKETVVFVAPIDANSVVPERAVGAQSAGNLYLLLKLLEDFKNEPPARSVLLAAVNAHTGKYLGERILVWHMLSGNEPVESMRDEIARDMRVARLFSVMYSQLKLERVDMDEVDVNAWVSVLWQLNELAQDRGKDAAKKDNNRPDILSITPDELREMSGDALDALCQPIVEPPLDLSIFTEEDHRAAMEAAIVELENEAGALLSKLSSDEAAVEQLKEDIEHVKGLRDLDAEEIEDRLARAKTVFDDERLLEDWREKLDGSTGKRIPIKRELQEEAQRNLNRLKKRIMGIRGNKELSDEEKDELTAGFGVVRTNLTRVLVLFNKIDIGIGRSRVRYRSIACHDGQREILKGYRDGLIEKFDRHRSVRRKMLILDTESGSIQETMTEAPVLVVNLDVNWRGERVGIFTHDNIGTAQWAEDFSPISSRAAGILDADGEKLPDKVIRAIPYVEMDSRSTHKQAKLMYVEPAALKLFHAGGNTPALHLASILCGEHMTFSPDDVFDRLDPEHVFRLHMWLRGYIRRLLADPEPGLALEDPGGGGLWSTLLNTYTIDEFAAKPTPDLEVPGCLYVMHQAPLPGESTATGASVPAPLIGDVVNCYRAVGDDTATAPIYGIIETTRDAPLSSVAYRLDSNWVNVVYAIDKGRIQTSKQMTSDVVKKESRTLPVFPCVEFPIYDRTDPTFVSDIPITVQSYWPMQARSQGDPSKYGTHGVSSRSFAEAYFSDGPAAVYLWRRSAEFEPERLIILHPGKNITLERRCALNITDEEPDGAGFVDADELGADFYAQVAGDMSSLNKQRRQEMKGVVNELLDEFIREGDARLAEMESQQAARDHTAYVQASYEALGNEVKAYKQVRVANDDMLAAVVLYMALMLPFCFFLQKLLFNLTRLEHNMLAFTVLFAATYAVFRLIHPAFHVASQPEAIFVAFILGAIGLVVIFILHTRFETEMNLVFRAATGMESEVGYGTVGQNAMLIGVNNMKRRRMRTVLTTATIILVVFTMLGFSSVSKKMQPTLVKKAGEAPYTGIFYHWDAGELMDAETAMVLENTFSSRGEVHQRHVLMGGGRLENVDGRTNYVTLEAVVGLEMAENGFLGRLPIVKGRYFSAPDANEIILAEEALETLHIDSDQVGSVKVRMKDREMTLVGTVDTERFRMLRDLDPDFSIVPFKTTVEQEQEDVSALVDLSEVTVNMRSMALLPATTATRLGAKPYSVSVRFPESEGEGIGLWDEVSRLLVITEAKFYIGSKQPFKAGKDAKRESEAGIYYVGTSYRTSIGGMSKLIIPLIIAGSIILNTMLGTAHERKYEIAVYNAIGLTPTHIFLFFLAEAFVYGVLGAVGGYLIGQIGAIALRSQLEEININFSSLMVGYAIIFTIGLVLLSTVYPAIVATRTAVPSGKRRWSLPPHDGKGMQVVFPFIYQPHLAIGVMQYLHEFFSRYTEQSMGDQIVDFKEARTGNDEAGRRVYSLRYAVALAPFDLGVTQEVLFETYYDDVVGSHRARLSVTRMSGQDTNWATTNRPFLEKLRKLLMRWRNMDPTQHNLYSDRGRELFGEEPETGSEDSGEDTE